MPSHIRSANMTWLLTNPKPNFAMRSFHRLSRSFATMGRRPKPRDVFPKKVGLKKAKENPKVTTKKKPRKPDEYDVVAQLKAASNTAEVEALLEKHNDLLNPYVVSAAMTKFRKFGRPQEALEVFETTRDAGVQQDAWTYSTAIACSPLPKAVELFEEMQEDGIHGDVANCAIITACSKGKEWDKAMDFFNTMRREPCVMTYTAMIVTCDMAGHWETALDLFRELKERKEQPSLQTYNATISACEKGGQWQTALDLLAELKKQQPPKNKQKNKRVELTPDIGTYGGVLSACAKAGRVDEAVEVFRELQDLMEPDAISYSALIAAYEGAERYDDAEVTFLTAYKSGAYPKILSIRGTIDLQRMNAPAARTAVRVALADLRRPVEDRCFYTAYSKGDLFIITGRGTHDRDAILRPAIRALFEKEFPGLTCFPDDRNPGRLVVHGRSISAWIHSNDSLLGGSPRRTSPRATTTSSSKEEESPPRPFGEMRVLASS